MMRFLKLSAIVFVLCICFSCKKNPASIQLTPGFYFLSGDTTAAAFNNNLILFSSSDTIKFNVIASSTYLLSNNVDITVAVNDDARSLYNSTHNTNYQPMPSAAYSFPATITATTSSIYDTIPVTIYKHALDVNEDYLLPINIVSAGGIAINLNSSVIYPHTISNKLSGIFNAAGTKTMYNGNAADSIINSIDTFSLTKNLVPADSTRSLLDYADLGSNGWKYYLSFFSGTGAPAFTVEANEVILKSVQPGSFKILSSLYDSTTKNIHIKSSYKNTSGNERIVEESLMLK